MSVKHHVNCQILAQIDRLSQHILDKGRLGSLCYPNKKEGFRPLLFKS